MSPIVPLTMTGVGFRWPGPHGYGIEIDEFKVAMGEKVLIEGASGTGKSTLIALAAGFVAPDAGEVRIMGREMPASAIARDSLRAEMIGLIAQNLNLLSYLSPIENVKLPMQFSWRRAARETDGNLDDAGYALLERLGLPRIAIERKRTRELSWGQQQRVAVARALIGSPQLLLADEPTSALDDAAQARFLDLIEAEIVRTGASLVMVSHDRRVRPHFDRVLSLEDIARVGALSW